MIFKIVATIILFAFYGCYFGKMLLQRRNGIKTYHMGKGKVMLHLQIVNVEEDFLIATFGEECLNY